MAKVFESKVIEDDEYKGQQVAISNSWLRAKEKTNLLESKIEVLAIHRMSSDMRQREKKDANGSPYQVDYVILTAKEIRGLMNRTDGDTYADIRHAALAMKQKVLIVEDRKNRQFVMKNVYGDIAYDDGRLYIEFEPSMESYFMDLKDNFTKLSLPILFSFSRNGAFQMYKLLKSYAYPPNLPQIDLSKKQEDLPSFHISYGLSELRMLLGYVDLDQSKLKEEGSKKHPDWDRMVEEEKRPKYKRWSDFNTRVIEPGIKEINEFSDIYIAGIRKDSAGRGGKITGVTFYIQHNRKWYEKLSTKEGRKALEKAEDTILNGVDEDDFADDMRAIIKEPLKTKDLKAIARKADYDMDKIRTAYEIAESSSKDIDNLSAFLIKAVEEGWSKPIKKEGTKNVSSINSNFTERQYTDEDYKKMMKTLLQYY